MNGYTKVRRRHLLITCLLISLVLFGLQIYLAAKFHGTSLFVGNVSFRIETINGIIQTLIFIVCMIMIFVSPRQGLLTAVCVIGLSFLGSVRAIVFEKKLDTIPGSFNCLLFILALVIISRQFIYSEKRAVTDEMTGISNSLAFDNDIHLSILHNERGYLIFVHLDGFVPVNANLGREAGDELLTVIAERLSDSLDGRASVYKIDGAEYAILVPENGEFKKLAEEVLRIVERPVTIKKNDIATNCYLTAFIGIAPYLNNDISAANLIKRADIAMNYAIKTGKEKICVFNDKMKEQIERESIVESLIKTCLQNGYFYLVYQPQYTTVDKRLRGFETLIRMDNPNGENVYPGEFIAVAEKSELILEIDQYVLRRAMTEFREICYASCNTITVAINVSASDIAREGFADRLLSLIEEVRFPAECLEVEITEYSFADAQNHTIENIRKLRDNHVMIALDDFGTGYTSLEQMMKLPVNLVKLDKSLIDNVAKKKVNTDFVKSVIYMGHLMDSEVIAEGVEFQDQLNMLESLDCDFIQGYLWGKPMGYNEARDLAKELFG